MSERSSPAGLSYASSGVNYDLLDAFKRACQRAASETVPMLAGHGLAEPHGTRGESAYLVETPEAFIAHVEEGLGTKNLIADSMLRLTGETYYRNIGIDTVATIVNDLVTTGAVPLSVAMHAAVGDSAWFADPDRSEELAAGFAEGCCTAGAVWGGGDTPSLRGIIHEYAIMLSGSAVGRIAPKSNRILGDVRDGDAIVLLASSGVQTNGLTLCRKIADRMTNGYLSRIADGRAYGVALLDPSVIYVRYIVALQKAGIRPHYAAHITGHGWRKLMRLTEPFVYRMTDVGKPPPVFDFIRKHGPVDLREAYATFNMGAGFGVYVDPKDVERCLELATKEGYTAWVGGWVKKEEGDRKAVEIVPHDITFEGATLQVR